MKSEPAGLSKIKTSCQKCVFATHIDTTQIDCSMGRLNLFDYTEAYNDDGNFYVLDGMCNFLRHEDWNGGKVSLEKLHQETALSFTVVINAFHLDSWALKNIKVNYKYMDKVKFKIIGPPNKNKNIVSLRDKLDCIATVSPYYNYAMHKVVSRQNTSYFVNLDSKDRINLDLDQFNNTYFDKPSKPIFTEFNGLNYVSSLAYDLTSYNTACVIFNQNMDELIKYAEKDKKKNDN